MTPTRLAAASAAIARAMGGRDTSALADVAGGEPRRAFLAAASGTAAPSERPIEEVHPSWVSGPLVDLHPAARAPLVGLMPPHAARYAALALERLTGEALEDRGGDPPSGLTAIRMAAALRPPLDAPPAFLGPDGARDPLGWLARRSGRLPVREIATRWPVETSRQAGMLEEPLVALAACLSGHSDEARGFASLMPRSTGRAFLAARARWALVIEPDVQDDLRGRIVEKGGHT